MVPKLDPLAIARRSFLHQSTYGLGGMALAMLGREATASAAGRLARIAPPAALPGQGQAGDLPLHGRRSLAV